MKCDLLHTAAGVYSPSTKGELGSPVTRAASGAMGKRAAPQKEKEDTEERRK